MSPPDPPVAQRLARESRTVRADRAFAWYAEALRLFKRHPFRFAALAVTIIVVELVLDLIPVAGRPAANIVVPLLACSLLYASLATDRGDQPQARHLAAPFAAPFTAVVAVLLASVLVFAAEWLVAWHVAGVNLLASDDGEALGVLATFVVYGAGVAVSLPLTLVPLLALFEQAGVRDAFVMSAGSFLRNMPAFLLYGALSIALLGIAFVTLGLGLALALPLWAASSYAAWKDLFAIA
jgi:uncharacterized membrane protein